MPDSILYLYKIKSSPPQTKIDLFGCIVAECIVHGIVKVYNLVRLKIISVILKIKVKQENILVGTIKLNKFSLC
jgi:hypothetical protein